MRAIAPNNVEPYWTPGKVYEVVECSSDHGVPVLLKMKPDFGNPFELELTVDFFKKYNLEDVDGKGWKIID